MRVMLRAKVPVEAGNAAIEDGSLPAALQEVMAVAKPEAVYVGPDGGERCATIVFDMDDSSDLPAITEPLFTKVNAAIEISPVMDLDDLFAGMARLG